MTEIKLVKIRIPVVVTADGKWAAQGSHSTVNDPDWSMVDEMCDFDNPTISPQRFWIEVQVPQPQVKTIYGAVLEDDEAVK